MNSIEEIITKIAEYEESGNYPSMFSLICQGLEVDCRNYELYLLLGNYYLAYKNNPDQAFLCYENALFYCNDDNDRGVITDFYNNIKQNYNISVNNTSIVIVSYNACSIMKDCLESIRQTVNPLATQIVIIDNSSTDGITEYLSDQNDILLYKSTENLGFGKGSNLGIELADSKNDIFFLNNDTILTPNALFWLRMSLYDNIKIGATGCYSNYPGNDQSIFEDIDNPQEFLHKVKNMNIPHEKLGFDRIWLSGFALLIKRNALNIVGGFDLSYGTGYFEDNDLCMRLIKNGYTLRACNNSVIFHYGSTSFKKNPEKTRLMILKNRNIFMEKWDGIDLNDYSMPALNIVSWIEQIINKANPNIKILEISCKAGVTLSKIEEVLNNPFTVGIENDKRLYDIAKLYHKVYMNTDEIKDDIVFDIVISEAGDDLFENNTNLTQALDKKLNSYGCFIFTISTNHSPEEIQNKLSDYMLEIKKINGIYNEQKLDKYIVVSQKIH